MLSIKNIKILISLFVFVGVLQSCQEEDVDLNDFIKETSTNVKYTIEGQITTTPSKQHIIITQPASINNPENFQGVSNATVNVTDGVNTWNFTELPPNHIKYETINSNPFETDIIRGIYESDTYFAGIENTTYTLTVVINGKTYTAQQTMPQADELSNFEFATLQSKNARVLDIFGMPKSAILEVDETPKDEIAIFLAGRLNFHNRNNIEDVISTADETHILATQSGYESKTLRRYTITEDYKDYVWSIIAETRGKYNATVEPTTLASNFNDEEVSGYFSTVSVKEYDVNPTAFVAKNLSIFNVQKQYKANYASEGEIKIIFKPTGECELQGFGNTLKGAYEVENTNKIKVYFTDMYNDVNTDLYNFYSAQLKQDSSIVLPSGEVLSRATHGYFTIENTTTIKSEDDVIWTVF